MWRIAVIVFGFTLASGGAVGDAKKPTEPIKDGYFKLTFEAKGVLKLTLDKKTGAITRVSLDGAGSTAPLALADDKALHAAAKKLDGKMVIASGDTTHIVLVPTGLSSGGERIQCTVTAFRAVEDKK